LEIDVTEWLFENKGTVIFISLILIGILFVAIVNPEPIPTITRQIQMSRGVYDWGFVIVDKEGNEIGNELNWHQLMDNETNILTIGVKNTGTMNITLTIWFEGDVELEENFDFGNGTVIKQLWHVPKLL